MELTNTLPVSLTPGAVTAIQKLMERPDFDKSQRLRVGVKGGGCSGMTYVLGFEFPTDRDQLFEIAGVPCMMEKAHEIYLLGIEVDWHDGLDNRGFTFSNPNASKTCGCGTSFAV